VGTVRRWPAQLQSSGGLLAGYPATWGGNERLAGRPAAGWPWGATSADAASGPWAVRRVPRDLIMLAAGLAVFAGCAVMVANGRVGPAERAVFHAVNGLPGWLYQPMLYAQYLGVLAMPLVVAAGALVWRRWRLAAALVLVVPLKLGLEQVAKLLVQRQRPGTTVPDAILRGVPHGGLSFTSGHAIITFAIAGLLVLVLPRRWGVLAIVLAVCNAAARVYLGAHNPLDVVGGAAIGLAIAAVLDLILDVARDRGAARQGSATRRGWIGPPVGVSRGKS
jgi:membrane-associated phospholipid phosphatase